MPDIEDKSKYTELTDNIYFQCMLLPYSDSLNLTTGESQSFCDGLKLVDKYLYKLQQKDSCLIIALRSFLFSDCYVQAEGFTASAIQWAGETVLFPMLPIKIQFDRLKSQYGMFIFNFSSV